MFKVIYLEFFGHVSNTLINYTYPADSKDKSILPAVDIV